MNKHNTLPFFSRLRRSKKAINEYEKSDVVLAKRNIHPNCSLLKNWGSRTGKTGEEKDCVCVLKAVCLEQKHGVSSKSCLMKRMFEATYCSSVRTFSYLFTPRLLPKLFTCTSLPFCKRFGKAAQFDSNNIQKLNFSLWAFSPPNHAPTQKDWEKSVQDRRW